MPVDRTVVAQTPPLTDQIIDTTEYAYTPGAVSIEGRDTGAGGVG